MKFKGAMGVSVLVLVLVSALAGCGEKSEEAKATQVAAKVNGDEITVHQINNAMAKLGNIGAEQAKPVAKQVLKSLVDQQLLVSRAIEDKIDRDPKVVQAIEDNRRQILANAYVERATQNVAMPTDAEVKDYYTKNPALFSERRIYKLQELVIQATPENAAAIKAKLEELKNPAQFAEWLKSQNIPARLGQAVKPAEQLPLELLPRLHAMKNGQFLAVTGKNRITVLLLADAQNQPISEEQSKNAIKTYLANSKKREVAVADLKKLREKAKIEYLGEYVGMEKEVEPAAPAKPAADAPAEAANDAGIAKGVEGLK